MNKVMRRQKAEGNNERERVRYTTGKERGHALRERQRDRLIEKID